MSFIFLLLPFLRGHKSLSAVKELQAFGFAEEVLPDRNKISNQISVCVCYKEHFQPLCNPTRSPALKPFSSLL